MFGLRSNESRVGYFEESQPGADGIRDQPVAGDITTSGAGDAIRGRTDEAASGTHGRANSIRGPRNAEASNGAALKQNQTQKDGVQNQRS